MSYGQSLLGQYLDLLITKQERLQDYRPDWLAGLELDFYYPALKLAIEFNGDQHYYHTGFGSPQAQRNRDRIKRKLCNQIGVKLITFQAIDLITHRVRSKIKNGLKGIRMTRMRRCHLDKKATQYRKTLIANYNSPTARKKNKGPRKAAEEYLRVKYKPGYAPHPQS